MDLGGQVGSQSWARLAYIIVFLARFPMNLGGQVSPVWYVFVHFLFAFRWTWAPELVQLRIHFCMFGDFFDGLGFSSLLTFQYVLAKLNDGLGSPRGSCLECLLPSALSPSPILTSRMSSRYMFQRVKWRYIFCTLNHVTTYTLQPIRYNLTLNTLDQMET